ncbi:endonuclease [Flavobacterium sp.]|uniref:endonuclease n=1 Tax=Flavobacterium sp. TaxID=239 RepID=UPI0037505EE4
MKKKLTIIVLLITLFGYTQIPNAYYITASASGYTLKTQLYNKIKKHKDKGYAGLWTTYSTSDRDKEYENDNSIIDLYSENPTGIDPYSFSYITKQCGTYSEEGNCYNREHIIPQSVFNAASPMVGDAHFITPTDGKVNGVRSNYPHGKTATILWTSLNGSKLGKSAVSGYTGNVFEPIDEFKGDIARMYFYFATRYENSVAGYSYPMFNGTKNQVFTNSFRDMLILWHNQDPVSAREIARNNAIYARQANRNPFIDHPEYVEMIWGSITSIQDTEIPGTPENLIVSSVTNNSLQLNWTAATDNIGVVKYEVVMNGVVKSTTITTNTIITGLNSGTNYSFYVRAIDNATNTSEISNTITTNTLPNSVINDLFFSEYVEGSANNKILEISNMTGKLVNLSSYTIKKQTNGTGVWSQGLSLSGTVVNGTKYTIVNGATLSLCYLTTNASLASNASEMSFNGNDAIGLFNNGLLIDIIGIFNSGQTNFSADETLRRKSNVSVPKITFNKTSDWTIFPLDDCNNIENKSELTNDKIYLDFIIYPNPSNGVFFLKIQNNDLEFKVEIYTIYGEKIYQKSSETNFDLSFLSPATYMMKVTCGEEFKLKKIIIN